MKKHIKFPIYSLTVLILIFVTIAIMPSIRSHIIMGAASWKESFNVVGKNDGLSIQFADPGSARAEGLSWFPRMLLFNATGVPLSDLYISGEGTADISIYYTYGDFVQGRSTIYDIDSPYSSAFYGAYTIRLKPVEGSVDLSLMELIESVTMYDYTNLILSQLGLNSEDLYFEAETDSISNYINAFGSDGWVKIDAKIKTRAMAHKANGFKQHYLQFGKPKTDKEDFDFPPMTLFGRTYAKCFKEKDIYVIFYIQAADEDLVNSTDRYLLSQSKVSIEDQK